MLNEISEVNSLLVTSDDINRRDVLLMIEVMNRINFGKSLL